MTSANAELTSANGSFLRVAGVNLRNCGSKFRKWLISAARNLRNLTPLPTGGLPASAATLPGRAEGAKS
jgi:hypothetical protein